MFIMACVGVVRGLWGFDAVSWGQGKCRNMQTGIGVKPPNIRRGMKSLNIQGPRLYLGVRSPNFRGATFKLSGPNGFRHQATNILRT